MLVKKIEDCLEFIAGDGSILREMLHGEKMDLPIQYSLAHAKVPVGKKTSAHKLCTTEVYYIISGRGLMYIDEESCEVTAGSTVYIPPNSVQYIENTGSEELIFLCIVEPAWRQEDEEVLE